MSCSLVGNTEAPRPQSGASRIAEAFQSRRKCGCRTVEKVSMSQDCHSEPFAHCHSERSEESDFMAQDKLREESQDFNGWRPFTSFRVTTNRSFSKACQTLK